MKLLLIEDNLSLQTTLVRTLTRRGFDMVTCADGLQALKVWQRSLPDVVLLDLSLPGQDGLLLLTQARALSLRTPVIILTARGTVGDRILGLNTGADDYLAKPFDLDELEARVHALLRRQLPTQGVVAPSQAPSWGGLHTHLSQEWQGWQVDKAQGAVYFQGQPWESPPRELALLRALLGKPGHAIAKEHLFECVFPGELEVHPEAIEVVAYRLRKKLIPTGTQLVTLRGLGYLLKAAP
jgi:two-component system, OmpR family, response regulator TctD